MSVRISASNNRSYKNYAAIDILKFICAILVVTIHVPPFGEYATSFKWLLNYDIMQYWARIAVPFFLICTGFLTFCKTSLENFSLSTGIRSAAKMYRLYLFWTLIYLPLSIRNILIYEGGKLFGTTVFIRDFLFVGSYFHLWYLNAVAFAMLLISVLLSLKVKLRWIIGSAFVLYLIGLMPQSYYGLVAEWAARPAVANQTAPLAKVFVTTRNGLFDAYLFLALGMLMAYRPFKFTVRQAIVGFVASMLLLYVEVHLLTSKGWIREHDMYLCLIPAGFFLVYLATHVELQESKIYRHLRECSSLIFFIHVWIDEIVRKIYTHLAINTDASCVRFITVLLLSICLSYLLTLFANFKGFKWMKKFY